MEKTIILADTSSSKLDQLKFVLSRHDYNTITATTKRKLTNILKKHDKVFVIVSCSFLDEYTGVGMNKIVEYAPSAKVIVSYEYQQIETARKAERMGALDAIAYPFEVKELLHKVEQHFSTTTENQTQGKKKLKPTQKKFIVGESSWAVQAMKQLKLVAPTDMSVIIEGESGTGKEVAARSIMRNSRRKSKPFVTLDCGAIPKELAGSELFGHKKGAFTGALNEKKGSFETADRGTLFLDEIGNLSYQNQMKLLRVLQEGEVKPIGSNQTVRVDVRVIAATNDSLIELVKKGDFREDLYHRLNEFSLKLAPLRDRSADIPIFLDYFLAQANEELNKSIQGFNKQALAILKKYRWPGNLREMGNIVKRAALLTDSEFIQLQNLPVAIINQQNEERKNNSNRAIPTLKSVVEKAEKEAILDALERCGWNKTLTAEKLGIKRRTLYNKIELYGINV